MSDLDPIKYALHQLIAERGPIGWRALEMRLRVPRNEFRAGLTLADYLDEMEDDGVVEKSDDGKYSVSRGLSALRPD